MSKFKVGDRVVCPCERKFCVKFYTVDQVSSRGIYTLGDNGSFQMFNLEDIKILEHAAVYESPLYEELK